MDIQTDFRKESIKFRAIRQRLGFGVTAANPLTDLFNGEALLRFAHAQPA